MESDTASSDLLLHKNGLFYKMPQALSTCVNRTFKREYAQRNSYTNGQTIVFDWNTGTSYVDPQNSSLTFTMTVNFAANTNAAEVVQFGSGAGACSIIEEIRIISKNGTEVDRIQNANILAKIHSDWTYDDEGNANLEVALKDKTFVAPADARSLDVCIPLKLLSGFFRPVVKDMLIPAGLASGLRIEITLADPARALFRSAGAGTGLTYTITDPEMLLLLSDLDDPTQATLMQESAENGLEYSFPSYFATSVNTTQTSINEQVKKAVSSCTKVFATAFNVSGADSVALETKDGFDSIHSDQFVNFQYRVGSKYFPQQPITKPIQAWYVTNSTWAKNKLSDVVPNSVNYTDYVTEDKFLVGVPLDTSDKMLFAGLPINNSAILELRLQLLNAGGLTRQVVVFMEYLSVARTFINKTDVKI